MKKIVRVAPILALALLTLLAGTVGAQDGETEGETVELAGGYVIAVPDDWDMRENNGVYVLVNGDLLIYVMTPDVVVDNFDLADAADAAGVLMTAYGQMSQREINTNDVEIETIEDRAVASTEFELSRDDQLGISVVIEVVPGKFALMEFHAPTADYAAALDAAMTIMLSLRESKAGGAEAGDDSGGLASVPIEPCAVHANRAGVQLRVGPGPNRGIYREMEQGPYLAVLGKATASDGSLWWRLDAVTGDANQLWVADTDVEQRGGCEYVVDVDAPPIIPALPRPEPDSAPGGPAPAPTGLVACPIVNLSVFTMKGTMSGPGGTYSFEVPANDYVTLMVPAGNYFAQFFCDGCGGLSGTNTWMCDGYTYITLSVG